MKIPEISVDETQCAALRGVSAPTQQRHRRRKIGPRAFRAEGAKGWRYRLRDIQAEQEAADTEAAS
jgi:hypothetical protein